MALGWNTLCVISVVISLVIAAVDEGNVPEAGAKKRQSAWCIHESLTTGRAITLGSVDADGKSFVSKTIGRIVYSASLRKILTSTEELPPTGREIIDKYFDFPGQAQYTVINNSSCRKTLLPHPFRPLCVPDNSTMTLIKSYFGVNDQVQFIQEFMGTIDDIHYRVSFTRISFVPVFLDIWGARNNRKVFETQTFYNSSLHDIPSDVFNPPAICHQVPMTTEVMTENFLEDELKWPFL